MSCLRRDEHDSLQEAAEGNMMSRWVLVADGNNKAAVVVVRDHM